MPKLLVKSGEKRGFVLRFSDASRVTIGRESSNSLVLPDRRVSRHHACVFPQGEGFIIEDLNSVNGTIVNNHHTSRHALHLGDEIMLGSTVLQYISRDASEELQADGSTADVKVIHDEQTPQPLSVEACIAPDHVPSFEDIVSKADPETLKVACQKLMILYRISNDLGTIVDLKRLLDRINELVIEVTKADRSVIMLKDQETNELDLRAAGSREDVPKETVISKTITSQVVRTGESILTTDALLDERFKRSESIVFQGIRSTMCVPIKYKDSILGVIHVDTKGKTVTFTRADLELLSALSNQAAVAIENARLFDDLKTAHEELKEKQAQVIEGEKLSALGKLAGGVAHEINNPLTSIMGYAQFAAQTLSKDEVTPDDVKESAEYERIIQEECHRCEQIVQDLLQFGRRKEHTMESVSINHVIERALTIARFHLKDADVEIRKDLAGRLPETIGDANQLQQVFLNLIINARDAVDHGGSLSITTASVGGKWIEVSFSDSGCGIPPDKLEEIFKPLYTTKEEGKGTGLGLSISQDIIEHHKGVIDVESVVGQGTTFIIKLPVEGDRKERM